MRKKAHLFQFMFNKLSKLVAFRNIYIHKIYIKKLKMYIIYYKRQSKNNKRKKSAPNAKAQHPGPKSIQMQFFLRLLCQFDEHSIYQRGGQGFITDILLLKVNFRTNSAF